MHLRNYLPDFINTEGELIATFGTARLIKTLDRKYELRGGSRADRAAAREYISLFMHHVVVREVAG